MAPSTASERVTRGLDLLRRRMDDSHGGDRRTWAVHLIPFARPSGFAKALFGSLAMTGTIKIVALAAIVVALLALVPKIHAPGAPAHPELARIVGRGETATLSASRSTPGALSEPVARSAVRTPELPDGATAAMTDPAANATHGRAHIIARVRLADGTRAAGARWSLSGSAGGADRVLRLGAPDGWENPSGVLGVDGILDVSVAPPQSFQFGLRIEAPEHVVVSWCWYDIAPDELKDLGEVTMRAAGAIAGRVVRPDGEPVTGRSVTVRAEEVHSSMFGASSAIESVSIRARTDSKTGRFVLAGLPEGPVQLTVSTEILGKVKGPRVRVIALETVETELVVHGLDAAAKRILVSASHPTYYSVPRPGSETIWLVAPDGSRRHAQANGSSLALKFDAANAPPYRIEILDPRFRAWSQDGVEPGTIVRAFLEGSAAVVLDVCDAEGEPVPLYAVNVKFLDVSFRPNEFQAHEGNEPLAGGVLDGLVPGDYLLTIRGAPGVASVRVEALEVRERRSIPVVLGESDVVAGHVVRANGAQVGGARVRLVRPATMDDSSRSQVLPLNAIAHPAEKIRWIQDDVTADAEGGFAFEFPPEGTYVVIAGDVGHPRAESAPLTFAVGQRIEGIEVVLPGGARLAGRIREPVGIDLTNWRVLPLQLDDGNMQQISTEWTRVVGGATFDCGVLPAGQTALYLLRPGNGVSFDREMVPLDAQLLEHLVLVEGQDVERTYPFPGTVPTEVSFVIRVEGVATDEATVRLYPVGVSKERYRIDGTRAQVGPERVQPGDYDVWVSGPGWGAMLPGPVTVAGGGETIELEVELEAGRVQILQGGQPVVNERFLLQPSLADFRVIQSFQSDAEGWGHLRAGVGDYLLAPQGPDRPSTRLAWPLPGGVTELVLD